MNHFLKILIFILVTIPCFTAYGQKLDSLKIKMNQIVTDFNIPGVSLIITTSEEILFAESAGVKNLETKEPLTPSDNIHLGSCTKALTGYLAGVCVEKGLINWNSTIIDVFPELEISIRKDYHNSTLNDFLSHHAGVIPFSEPEEWFDYEDKYVTEEQDIKNVRYNFVKWALTHEPVKLDSVQGKEDFIYSNAGYVVAASMLEKVSGKSWDNLIQKHIFQKMKINGVIGWPASKDETQTWGHWWNADSTELVTVDPKGNWQISNVLDPAGDIAMSALDYGKWLQKNLKGLKGEDKEWSKEFYEYLHYANFDDSYYSMGWGSYKQPDTGYTISNHSGSANTLYCHVVIIKELDIAIAAMSNAATDQVKSGVKKLIYDYYNTLLDE